MIHVIGLGLGDVRTLSQAALLALQESSLVIGSKRQLGCVKTLLDNSQEQQYYPSPLANVFNPLNTAEKENKNTCLLASGDPLFYGISDLLLRYFSAEQLTFYSNTSSIQRAFSQIKKSWQQAKVISLHGRPLNNLIPYLANHQLYALLTDKQSQPQAIASLLCEHGCANADIWVCEALGTSDEQFSQFKAAFLSTSSLDFHPLHVTLVETKSTQCTLPSFPGFDDSLFYTDTGEVAKGMITKKEVRLVVLSLLQSQAGDVVWDIGAGCGTVAVECAYWYQQSTVYAVEYHEKRLICLEKNKHKFGLSNLYIIADKAPRCLAKLPSPNAIFIGGTAGSLHEIMDDCWKVLPQGGRLVINCVTENCKSESQYWLNQKNINDDVVEWTEISVSKGGKLARQLLMRPRLPVRLLKITKE